MKPIIVRGKVKVYQFRKLKSVPPTPIGCSLNRQDGHVFTWYEDLAKEGLIRQERYRKFFQEVIPEGEWKLIRKIVNRNEEEEKGLSPFTRHLSPFTRNSEKRLRGFWAEGL